MTKVLVREHNASEELDQLREFLNTEAQHIVQLTEENPATSGLAQDDLSEITWYILESGEAPTGLFTVLITDDGSGDDTANLIVMKDEFSPSTVLDQVRQKFENPEPKALMQGTDGYITGDASHLDYHEGVSPSGAEDPAQILELWRTRLSVPKDADPPSGGKPSEDDLEERAVPIITMRTGW